MKPTKLQIQITLTNGMLASASSPVIEKLLTDKVVDL
jgi:hypothetical protein